MSRRSRRIHYMKAASANGFASAVAIGAALCGCISIAMSGESSPLGRTYWVDDGRDHIFFVEHTPKATIFGAKIPAGESFVVESQGTSEMPEGGYQLRLKGGRLLSISKRDFHDHLTVDLWRAANKFQQHIFSTPPESRSVEAIAQAAAIHSAAKKRAADLQRAAWLARPQAAIGMTAAQVLESRQGAPNHVNRTELAHLIRDQWVYDDGRMFYFDNGILTAIQSTR